MKFSKQNFISLILFIVLLINSFMLYDLKMKYNVMNSQYFMLQSSIDSLASNINNNANRSIPAINADDVMTPTDLAEYLKIKMAMVYELATRDNTMPYVIIDGEYRFNKAAIDKWMETRKSIDIR